jgi:hypothetical protein
MSVVYIIQNLRGYRRMGLQGSERGLGGLDMARHVYRQSIMTLASSSKSDRSETNVITPTA